MKSFIADKNRKISKLALENLSDLSYSAFMKALRKKDVKVNGKRVSTDLLLNEGDVVDIYYSPIEAQMYSIVYQDENVLVIDKKSGYNSEKVFEDIKTKFESACFIHRLDTNTSGIMIFALNEKAESELLKGFKERTFDKYYLATVVGVPKKKEDVLRAYLIKDEKSAMVKVTDSKVKGSVEIITGYKLLSDDGETSLLKVKLYTGKTHQIRAHLAHVGYPIVGDGKYGDYDFNNKVKCKSQMLKACELTLNFKKGYYLYYLNEKTFVCKV